MLQIRMIDRQWCHLVFIFCITLIVYIFSMPHSVVLEDDGYFVLAAYYNGVAHPPGYPLYTLLGHIFTQLPFGSIPFRVHLLSAVFGSLTSVAVWLLVIHLYKKQVFAYVAAIGYSLSSMFWSQAIIAEVYTLNTFFFFSLLLMSMAIAKRSSRSRCFFFLLLYGLSLSNHWPLTVLSTPAFIAILWGKKQHLTGFYSLAGLLLGLLPYAWMIVNSRINPDISFYGPIQSFSDLWFYISRQAYAEQDMSITAGLSDRIGFLVFFCKQLLAQFGYAGVVLGVTGFLLQWKSEARISICFTLAFLGNSLLLILLLGFDHDLLHENIFRVYPLVAYGIFMIWIVTGLHYLLVYLADKITLKPRMMSAGLVLIILVSILPQSVMANYRANDIWAINYARAVLDSLDENAVLFTHGDLDQGSLVYLNRVLSYRADVSLYSSKGVLLSNRLFFPMRQTNIEKQQAIHSFISTSKQPVYFTYGLEHEFNTIDYGLVRKIDKDQSIKRNRILLTSESIDFLNSLLNSGEPADPWQSMHYKLILNDFCRLLIHYNKQKDEYSNELGDVGAVDKVCYLYPGKLERIDALINNEVIDMRILQQLLLQAEKLKHQSVLKSDIARLDYYWGLYYSMADMPDKAKYYFQKSITKWKHPGNPAFARLGS